MEWLKIAGLRKSFLILSVSCVLLSLLLLGIVLMACNSISSTYPTGGLSISIADGSVVRLEEPTPSQERILLLLDLIELASCILIPMGGLALSCILYYHIKLKQPIAALQNGITRIGNHDLNFSMPVRSQDELGRLCTAFDTMREELLKSNQELWRQAEERKRLNAAFSHDLRNPITVLKGTIKLLRQGTADPQAIDRLETYTARIEQYVEAMSSIQRLEQIPVCRKLINTRILHEELRETANLLAPALNRTIKLQEEADIELDHGLFLTVAENLIGNAARFAQKDLVTVLEIISTKTGMMLILTVCDDGSGFSADLIKNGPKPFGKKHEDAAHFGMGLYTSQMLCEKHGGELKLENKPDGGATVTASFLLL